MFSKAASQHATCWGKLLNFNGNIFDGMRPVWAAGSVQGRVDPLTRVATTACAGRIRAALAPVRNHCICSLEPRLKTGRERPATRSRTPPSRLHAQKLRDHRSESIGDLAGPTIGPVSLSPWLQCAVHRRNALAIALRRAVGPPETTARADATRPPP